MATIILSAIFLCVSTAIAAAGDTCYFPDGTSASDKYVCDPDAAFSACCAPGDMCLTNGLCRASTSDGTSNDYWRESCTDQTWESDSCPKYCYNSTTSPTVAGLNGFVEACGTDTYCCGNFQRWLAGGNDLECCNNPLKLFTAGPAIRLAGPTVVTATFPATATASSSALYTSSTISAPPTTSAASAAGSSSASAAKANGKDTSGLSSSATIGIGVGVGVGATLVLVALVVGFCFWRKHGKKNKDKNGPAMSEGRDQPQYYAADHHGAHPAPAYEVPGSRAANKSAAYQGDRLVEAPGESGAAELGGR